MQPNRNFCRLALAVACTLGTGALTPATAGADVQRKAQLESTAPASPASSVFPAFAGWANSRVQTAQQPPAAAPVQPIAIVFSPTQQTDLPSYLTQTPQAAWVPASQFGPARTQTGQVAPFSPWYSATPIVLGQPDVPLNPGTGGFDPTRNWNAGYNYQGMQIAVVVLDALNQPVEIRALNAPFRSGERFKLRLVTSFDALASVDAYRASVAPAPGLPAAPSPWAGQLYPARSDQVVRMRGGETVYLPLGPNEYFVFDSQVGVERLVINVRHARAQGSQVNTQPVYRQDSAQGSSYVQLTPAGAYPAMSPTVHLEHFR